MLLVAPLRWCPDAGVVGGSDVEPIADHPFSSRYWRPGPEWRLDALHARPAPREAARGRPVGDNRRRISTPPVSCGAGPTGRDYAQGHRRVICRSRARGEQAVLAGVTRCEGAGARDLSTRPCSLPLTTSRKGRGRAVTSSYVRARSRRANSRFAARRPAAGPSPGSGKPIPRLRSSKPGTPPPQCRFVVRSDRSSRK